MGVKTRKLGNVSDQLVQWQAVHVADGSTALTTVAGRGYFIDTTSGTQTVNLPASGSSTLGDTVQLKDYARKWATNKITMGSNTFDGVASQTPEFNTDGQTVTFVHMGGTKGWSLINEDTTTGLGAQFVAATGGTVATSGNFKIHSFTGDGNFVVSQAGNAAGSNTVSYMVVAGGGSGGTKRGGGGGAGGFREGLGLNDSYTGSPQRAPTGVPVPAATYPITVGGGGAAGVGANPICSAATTAASKGSNSVFSTITSTGGGRGKGTGGADGCSNGGSGGGGFLGTPHIPAPTGVPSGSGNTPPVSPSQGNNGGTSQSPYSPGQAAGGGGAGGVGLNSNDPGGLDGRGGPGATTHITGSPVVYAGGGGGGARPCGPQTATVPGGGGRGANNSSAPWGDNSYGESGTANLGGGGGGSGDINNANSGAGGKGIVIIRYKFQ